MKKAFKAYDIRGVYDKDFNKEDVYKIGFFLPGLLNASEVLVGRDVRHSSGEVFEALSAGITDAGAHVKDAGLCTTPMVYWATARYGFKASVQITASHNPKEYNGLKVSRENALPVGYDSGLKSLLQMAQNNNVTVAAKKGAVSRFDFRKDYIDFQKQYQKNTSGLRVVADCSNGMAGIIIKQIAGNAVSYLNFTPDGSFPNHEPNPLVEANAETLKQAVINSGADVGALFDGDADRATFIDEKGRVVSPDLIIAVLGHHFLKDGHKSTPVLQDIRTSKAVGEYLAPMGARMHTWRVGRAYAALKLREIDGSFGGELAGHYYFKDFYYSDSGILAFTFVTNILADFKAKGISFSQLLESISPYANSGEINFTINEKHKAMEAVKDHFMQQQQPDHFFDFDGYRLEYPEWWFNIRPSNTEPYLRFLAEAKNEDLLAEKIAEVKKILEAFS
jgi:phosphomannomutase